MWRGVAWPGYLRACVIGLILLATLPAGVVAQSIPPSLGQTVTSAPGSPVLTIDQDRLFRESAYGRRIEEDLNRLSGQLAAENRRIEAELTEEERLLTEQRPTLDPKEFTARADAFDARVEEIRNRQDSKATDLSRQREIARTDFLRQALPVLSTIMRERGAVAILNAQAIFLSFDTIDITGAAIERIDQRIGRGPGLSPLPENKGAPGADNGPATPVDPDAPDPDAPAPR